MRLELEEALRKLREKIDIQDKTEKVSLENACNRILATDIVAKFNVPSYPKSAMDGYAVNYEDVLEASQNKPVKLNVVGKINAGDYLDIKYKKNTAIRIMTGAYIPEGYNAVIKQEDTDYSEDVVEIYSSIDKWDNYCPIGEDIKIDSVVIEKYTKLEPKHLAVIASLGIYDVDVLSKMKVAVVATGSELLEPYENYNPYKVYNSSSYHIQAELRSNDVDIIETKCVADDIDLIYHTIINNVNKADVIITTGGASFGQKDYLPIVLEKIGAEILFRGCNIRPGTPVTAGYIDGSIILCCSGNPFAAVVNFNVFFWEMLAKKMNNNIYIPKLYRCKLKGLIKKRALISYVRAYYDGEYAFVDNKGHNSSVISSSLKANCLICVPAERQLIDGDEVEIQMI